MDSAFLLGSPFMVKMVIEIDLISFSPSLLMFDPP